MKNNSGKASFAAIFVAIITLFAISSHKTTSVEAADKVYVCKYVGTPGVNETLQTGNNPIDVSINTLPTGWAVGGFFSDSHGRSYVLALSPQIPEPDIDDCPQVVNSPTPTPVPTVSPTATPTVVPTVSPTPVPTVSPTATPTVVPTVSPTPVPTVSPTATPTASPTPEASATATPNGDICANLDGIQLTMPDEYHQAGVNCLKYELGGPPQPPAVSTSQVLGASTSRVLGASTMAGTGAVEDAIFNSMFTLGSLLTSFGIMKNGKKKS